MKLTYAQRAAYAKSRNWIFSPPIPSEWAIEIDMAYRDGKQLAEKWRKSHKQK